MNSFPSNIQFKYNWRKYQKIFLDNFATYLEDQHIHVIAPPGSGKTVLGLEAMLRLNQPTLIIAPTIAIKNQWLQRFTELFLQTNEIPDWISLDLKNPKFITISTYQGVHSAMSGFVNDEENEDFSKGDVFLKKLKKLKIKTLILDEAHHLKKAWWKSLIQLKDALNPTVVALTATPPFDVSEIEWRNYSELNGPVDIEISVPELMKEKDLCPHQDLVYFSSPTKTEQIQIENIYKKAQEFFDEIKSDNLILEAISTHPVYTNPENSLDFIYENISSYTSGLVFMKFRGLEIPEIHFEIIGDEQHFVPEFDFFWLEELLDFYLFDEHLHFKKHEIYRTELENRLRRNGFLENKFISFFNTKKLNQTLNSSIGKLESVHEIALSEYKNLGKDLKMVILTDFIRKDFLINEKENNLELTQIGAIPIFEILRRNQVAEKKIAVLTGSIVILPKSIISIFLENCKNFDVQFSELGFDENFVLLKMTEQLRNSVVQTITTLFEKGEFQILIGTKSLLGEGWDAPKINSLVLASFVSTFVMTNQMRGRAIRIDKENPFKTGNIWHLVCFDAQSELGGNDFQKMQKRFKTFVGISNFKTPTIENNFERLNIKTIEKIEEISEINNQTMQLASGRENLTKNWESALHNGNVLIEEIKIPFSEEENIKTLQLKSLSQSIKNFSGTFASTLLMFLYEFFGGLLKSLKQLHSFDNLAILVLIFGILGFLMYGRKLYVSGSQYLKYKNIAKNLEKISKTIVMALCKEKIFRTPIDKLKIVATQNENGDATCHLEGGTNYEQSKFILTLQELFSPVDNPRYLLKTKRFLMGKSKEEFYPVPEFLAKNKKSAERFSNFWNDEVGNASLIFTRTLEGRKLLLKLRFKTVLHKNKRIEHLQKWVK